ncbi:MAG TPA: hypothetical protein VHG53_05285 [Candidatus Limnocylindria bacterium]|nr:hypothetical protein [Candidatus Limnocylindria bacterium]
MTPLDGVDAITSAGDRAADLEQLKAGAALLTQHGNRVAALAVLWAAVAIDPVDHAVHRRLAATLAAAGDLDGSANEYGRYVEFQLASGDIKRATAELHYAATTLGRLQPLMEVTQRVARELPALLAAQRAQDGPVAAPTIDTHDELAPADLDVAPEPLLQLPVGHPTRITFYTCLHDDGEAAWLQLEGGTAEVLPEKVRLTHGGQVIETRRCITIPAGRKSHARPNGDSRVWVVLRAPEEMLRAVDRDEADDYAVEALIAGKWLAVDLRDTGCRFGAHRESAIRSA